MIQTPLTSLLLFYTTYFLKNYRHNFFLTKTGFQIFRENFAIKGYDTQFASSFFLPNYENDMRLENKFQKSHLPPRHDKGLFLIHWV